MKIPNESMGARRCIGNGIRYDPVRGVVDRFRIDRFGRMCARPASHDRTVARDHVDDDGRVRQSRQIVVNVKADGCVIDLRLVERKRSTLLAAGTHPIGHRGPEKIDAALCDGCSHLTQRRDVVHHPEGTAVGRNHEIVAVHREVADRGDGQIELQRLPEGAIVERNVDAALGAGVEQPRATPDPRARR